VPLNESQNTQHISVSKETPPPRVIRLRSATPKTERAYLELCGSPGKPETEEDKESLVQAQQYIRSRLRELEEKL
jgi:hypothetical protein